MADKKREAFFRAELELTRISKNNVRYRVVNPSGAAPDVHHVQFDRSEFPVDDDFNMDFIMNDLAKDGDDNEPSKEMLDKQKKFRSWVKLHMVIVK